MNDVQWKCFTNNATKKKSFLEILNVTYCRFEICKKLLYTCLMGMENHFHCLLEHRMCLVKTLKRSCVYVKNSTVSKLHLILEIVNILLCTLQQNVCLKHKKWLAWKYTVPRGGWFILEVNMSVFCQTCKEIAAVVHNITSKQGHELKCWSSVKN